MTLTSKLSHTNPPAQFELLYKKLRPEAVLPRRAYDDAIGFDLAACLMSETGKSQQILIPPRNVRAVTTGLVLIPPKDYFISVCSRSGLASRNPVVFVSNAPGIIDPDYTGELIVLLYNGGNESVYVKHGDFIGQAVLFPATRPDAIREIWDLPTTKRGEKGLGSSG